MTVFEEKVRNFVLNGIPFEHTPNTEKNSSICKKCLTTNLLYVII